MRRVACVLALIACCACAAISPPKSPLLEEVGSGEMTVMEATLYFQYPHKLVGHIVKFKHMTHGVKDKPRFPTYVSHRLPQDMA